MCLFSAVAAECFGMFSTAVVECGSWGEFVFNVQFCCALSVLKGALEHFSLLQSHFVPSPSPSIQSLAARSRSGYSLEVSLDLPGFSTCGIRAVTLLQAPPCCVFVVVEVSMLRLVAEQKVEVSIPGPGARILCKKARVPCFGCALNNPKWSKLARISTMQRLA